MRVLHVLPDLSVSSGGLPVAVLGMCRGLARAGVEITLLATDYSSDGRQRAGGIDVRLTGCQLAAWRFSASIATEIRSVMGRADLVHLHGLWQYPSFAAARACWRDDLPYLVSPHGMLTSLCLSRRAWRKRPYLWLIERRILGRAAALVFTSRSELAQSTVSRRFNDRAHVVPLAVGWESDPDPGDAVDFRERLGIEPAARIVLFVGRLDPLKRPGYALRAFLVAARAHPDAVLIFCGPDSGLRGELEGEARRAGLGSRVFFTGSLNHEQMRTVFRASSLLLHPSEQESYGLAVPEALLCGRPVVVTEAIPLAREIEHAGAGWVAAPDPVALGRALEIGLRGPRLEAAGRAAREFARRVVSRSAAAERLTEVYREALARPSRSAVLAEAGDGR